MELKDIVLKLTEKHMTLAAMESCTGGAFTNSFTNIEGASEVLKYSAVTYSNEYKIKMGVDKDIIDKYSVYSFETADSMSLNISKFTNSDIGIGITGKLNRADIHNNYGEDNVVYISVYLKENNKYSHCKVKVNKETRALNKEMVVKEVVKLLEDILVKYE